ncbi:hypothetical protein AB0L67_40780 [Streptomyces flaveolus]
MPRRGPVRAGHWWSGCRGYERVVLRKRAAVDEGRAGPSRARRRA